MRAQEKGRALMRERGAALIVWTLVGSVGVLDANRRRE